MAGSKISAVVDAVDPKHDPLAIAWYLEPEAGAELSDSNAFFAISRGSLVTSNRNRNVTVTLPTEAGAYRLFVTVTNIHGGAAVANVPVLVTGGI